MEFSITESRAAMEFSIAESRAAMEFSIAESRAAMEFSITESRAAMEFSITEKTNSHRKKTFNFSETARHCRTRNKSTSLQQNAVMVKHLVS